MGNDDLTQNEMDARLSIKLPSKLLEMSREKSKKTGVSLSFKLRQCLEDWLNETIKFYFLTEEDRTKAEPFIRESISGILSLDRGIENEKYFFKVTLNQAITPTKINSVVQQLQIQYYIQGIDWKTPYNPD